MNWKILLHDYKNLLLNSKQITESDLKKIIQFFNKVKEYWEKESLIKLRDYEINELENFLTLFKGEVKIPLKFGSTLNELYNNPPYFLTGLPDDF